MLTFEGTPISELDDKYLKRTKQQLLDGIDEINGKVKEIDLELQKRIEIRPIKITMKNLMELDSSIIKVLNSKAIVQSYSNEIFFQAKYKEYVKKTIPDPTKVSKRMLNALTDSNYHSLEDAISNLQKEVCKQ